MLPDFLLSPPITAQASKAVVLSRVLASCGARVEPRMFCIRVHHCSSFLSCNKIQIALVGKKHSVATGGKIGRIRSSFKSNRIPKIAQSKCKSFGDACVWQVASVECF